MRITNISRFLLEFWTFKVTDLSYLKDFHFCNTFKVICISQFWPSSLTMSPRATPGDSYFLTARGWGRVFAPLSFPGGRGFELKKFSIVLKEKCRKSICFKLKETGGSLQSRCFALFNINFCKNVRCLQCIFNKMGHFRPFRSFS